MIDVVRIVFDTMAVSGFMAAWRFSGFKIDAEHKIKILEAENRRMHDKIKTLETLNSRM